MSKRKIVREVLYALPRKAVIYPSAINISEEEYYFARKILEKEGAWFEECWNDRCYAGVMLSGCYIEMNGDMPSNNGGNSRTIRIKSEKDSNLELLIKRLDLQIPLFLDSSFPLKKSKADSE